MFFNEHNYGTKVSFFIATLSLFLSLSVPVSAAGTPSIFSYQGRLTNSGGNLLGGSGSTYYFKFSIWDDPTAPSGGSQLWPTSTPGIATTTVRQGVFNVNIGDTANGYPDSLDYNFNTNKNIYLQVQVSSTSNSVDFETISPRQRISSTIFAQMAGAVSGIGQSSFGTTTPFDSSIVSIESTSTQSTGLSIRGILGQLANLFQIQDSIGSNLFVVASSGDVGVGTAVPSTKLDILGVNSVAQLRISQSSSTYSDFYVEPDTGDVQLFSTGGNFRLQDENLSVCAGGSCGVITPTDSSKGNIIVGTSIIFDNKFRIKQTGTSTMIMYDSIGSTTIEFDEGQ